MRFISIDFLRGIAAFGIVGCHLSLMPRISAWNCTTGIVGCYLFWMMSDWSSHVNILQRRGFVDEYV